MPPKRISLKKRKILEYVLDNDLKNEILMSSYIGKKGYTIKKSILSDDEYTFLKNDLFLKPVMPGPSFGVASDNSFPVFRENQNKIYLPRFYGIERYGMPQLSELEPGEDIDLNFIAPLRDYQENIVDIYKNHVSENNSGGGILEVYCGSGKCMGLNTPIFMYDGSIKMVQDIIIGDIIMGDNSTPRNVLTIACGREEMYRIVPEHGDSYIVNRSHILSLKCVSDDDEHFKLNSIYDISLIEYLKTPHIYRNLVGYRVMVNFEKKDIDIDPYVLGFWLGSRNKYQITITTESSVVVEYFQEYVKSINCKLVRGEDKQGCWGSMCYTVILAGYNNNSYSNPLLDIYNKYNLLNNKHIPTNFKCNERKIQMEILAGFIDANGSFYNYCFSVTDKNERLIDDIVYISRTLGFAASKTIYGQFYKTHICGDEICEIPVKTFNKLNFNKCKVNLRNTPIYVDKLNNDRYYGFEIDGNRRFVLGDCTVTHNTVMALKIVSELSKKTLILVHKEFLMNQWIERIEEFLPGARVGKIQANICDCENKDIVIGMIQTMYNKTFPQGVYSQFGLTIVDEVHRIGSEEFSKTLLTTITPYMLGISATVERKDKLTKLLYMFIGPKIHSMVRKQEDTVSVRAIEYKTNDIEFNTVEYDFRGNTKFSTMISKLSSFVPRSEFIVKVVHDLLIENKDGQVMILCHNRCLLTCLYENINSKGIYTVGFYVGGMKQNALLETESKQIVLATYAMAAEALDIKTLSILIMASPKTDITQSVGRILRTKHDNPIIVDIVDSHDMFQRQWLKRKSFYKKSKYIIRYIQSSSYTSMDINWSDDTSWDVLYDPEKKSISGKTKKSLIDGETGGKCMINTNTLS